MVGQASGVAVTVWTVTAQSKELGGDVCAGEISRSTHARYRAGAGSRKCDPEWGLTWVATGAAGGWMKNHPNDPGGVEQLVINPACEQAGPP